MNRVYLKRLLRPPERSFFLFGPRGTGKSTWLRHNFKSALYLDLLESSLFLELSSEPQRLEALVAHLQPGEWVIIDEIQKAPVLLDEVHRQIENRGLRFALSGSSARKLKKAGTNLLGGRVLTRRLDAFSFFELGDIYDIDRAVEWGTLPSVYLDKEIAPELLDSYVNTYIREEIRQEDIVRKLTPFMRFLAIAGRLNAKVVNGANISREASVPRSSVDTYFSILVDTLLARMLPAYRPRLKVRETAGEKFYWFDPGVARAAAGLHRDPLDRLWKGDALETLIFHELNVYNHTSGKERPLFYYRTSSGVEVDFIIELRKVRAHTPARIVCIEVKSSEKWNRKWEQPLRSIKDTQKLRVVKMIGVYRGKRVYRFDGVWVFPAEIFLDKLYKGDIF